MSEAGCPDEYWMERPHPRGERTPSLLESLEEELGLPRLFQGTTEEEETPTPPAPRTAIARRPRQEPVDANLSGLFAKRRPRAALLDDDDSDGVLGDIFEEDETATTSLMKSRATTTKRRTSAETLLLPVSV